MPRRAVFLDRDGVLTVPSFRDGRSFAPRKVEDFAIYEDALEATTNLSKAGFLLVVVTNQPDIGNGLMPRQVLEEMHRILADRLPLDRIEVCAHTQRCGCDCRKPAAGMLTRAAKCLDIDLPGSYMVGDRASDIEAGAAAGCKTVFLDRGYTTEKPPRFADHHCACVGLAADWILSRHDRADMLG